MRRKSYLIPFKSLYALLHVFFEYLIPSKGLYALLHMFFESSDKIWIHFMYIIPTAAVHGGRVI